MRSARQFVDTYGAAKASEDDRRLYNELILALKIPTDD